MRSFVLALGLLAAASVTAADNLIPGNLAIVKSAALVKGVYKGTFAVPASPRGAFLAVFDTGGASDNYAFPEVQWKGLGKPAGSKGWKYKGAGSPTDPCTVVLVKANVIKHVCKGSGITLASPVVGALGVVLNVGDQRYCAAFGGRTVKNKPGNFKRKHAPAPSTCPVPCGTLLTKWGGCGSGDGQFGQPVGVAVDGSGNVYVSDRFIGPVCPAVGSAAIQKFTNSGTFLTKWGSQGTGDGQFNGLADVAVELSSGNVFVADQSNNRIQKFTNSGTFLTKWGSQGTGDGQFNQPAGVAVDGSGNVFVADAGNNRIQKFTNTGTFIGKWGCEGSGDGQFSQPTGVAVDASGNVFVIDFGNSRIQKFACP